MRFNRNLRKLSVIIPTLNEGNSGLFERVLQVYAGIDEVELIVADGGSEDQTLETAAGFGALIVSSDPRSRGARINDGIRAATCEMVLINHPRSILDKEGVAHLIKNEQEIMWGGFTHAFDVKHPLLGFTSWYSNNLRARFGGIVYLDHCKFAKKTLLEEAGSLPPVEIFEDTILSQRLFKLAGPPLILPYRSLTSAIRFEKNGVLKQCLLNQWLKVCFHLGFNHRKMNRLYEKNADLNAKGE